MTFSSFLNVFSSTLLYSRYLYAEIYALVRVVQESILSHTASYVVLTKTFSRRCYVASKLYESYKNMLWQQQQQQNNKIKMGPIRD